MPRRRFSKRNSNWKRYEKMVSKKRRVRHIGGGQVSLIMKEVIQRER